MDPVPRVRHRNVVTIAVGVGIFVEPAHATILSPEGVSMLSGLLLSIVQFSLSFPFNLGVVVPDAFGLVPIDGLIVVGLPHFPPSFEFGGSGVGRTDGRSRGVSVQDGVYIAAAKSVPFAEVHSPSTSASAANLPLVFVVDEVPFGSHPGQIIVG